MFINNAIGRRGSVFSLALAIFILLAAPACYIPGIIEPTQAADPPQGAVTGEPEIFYGKFLIYTIGDGKIEKLNGGRIDYMVGDEVYFPDNLPSKSGDYNVSNFGTESYLTYHYKDGIVPRNDYVASGRPEAIILRERDPIRGHWSPKLAMFYTNPTVDLDTGGSIEFGDAGDTPAGATAIGTFDPGTGLTSFALSAYGQFNSKLDVDVYSLALKAGSVLSVQGRYSQMKGFEAAKVRHHLQICLLGPDEAVIACSSHGLDFFKYRDPDLSAVIKQDGTYYLQVSDVNQIIQDPNGSSSYRLLVEASTDIGAGRINKGEIQPARSCNAVMDGDTVTGYTNCPKQLQGGATFEPDDLSTQIQDIVPDCDGVPGNGNEGDAGIYEMCGSIGEWGAGDGRTEYQEVDDKTTIEDGEYFVGQPTNVPAFVDTEATIIRTPDDGTGIRSLSMFVAYNTGIYWLESKDGNTGLDWNLATISGGTILGSGVVIPPDRAAIKPLNGDTVANHRVGGSSSTPVITSGILGFCDTAPAAGDVWGAPELEELANRYAGNIAGSSTGSYIQSPSGYPKTVALTFGGNGSLDTEALVDEMVGNTINTGREGIINTFFAPRYVAYPQSSSKGSGSIPMIFPGNTLTTRGMNGPGTPDNPWLYSATVGGYVYPLSDPLSGIFSGEDLLVYQALVGGGDTLGGNDERAFLLGDDEWNQALFHGDTLSPAAYWRKQRCHFYSIGSNFDRCAMASPEVVSDPTGVQKPGEEPVVILPGKDGRLDTVNQVLKEFRGDDALCHDGATVALCPGPDGRFGWQDVYIPLKGDDRIAVVYDGETATVGVSSGPDGILNGDTTMATMGYGLLDVENAVVYLGRDIICHTLPGATASTPKAVCPGREEHKIDMYSFSDTVSGVHRLMTIWPMYITSPTLPSDFSSYYLGKKDLYGVFDDEFCIVDGGPAICPGQDGIFQSYPLTQRVEVDHDSDLFVLHERVKGLMEKDCYSLRSEIYRDTFNDKDALRYVFYHDLGIRMDDRVRWSPDRGYFVSSGHNGINQSCTVGADERVIPMWEGLPNQPVITPGKDGLFQTYALKDEKFKWADNVYKISTGPDGISNSYARGDDRLEIFMGTGKADQPCVRSGDDHAANTQAQNFLAGSGATPWANDIQIYRIGERTGFDAFEVFGPKAVSVDDQIFLYFSALGWEEYPEMYRNSAGALGDVGECRTPGLDHRWGKRGPDYGMTKESKDNSWYVYDLQFFEEDFKLLLDNNESVGLVPRIGLATSTIKRLRANPSDWDIRKAPVLDVGQQCAGTFSLPIDLGLSALGMTPDTNFYGAYSPEIEFTETPDGKRLFLMFFSGLTQGEQDPGDLKPLSLIGLARSMDGIHWELVRQFKNVLATTIFDLSNITGSGSVIQQANPTIYLAGEDENGMKMYGMFFNQFESSIGGSFDPPNLNVDFRGSDHIGWALRRGMSYMSGISCSLSPDTFADNQDRNRRALQIVIMGLPVALAGIFVISRRRRKT